MHETDPVEVSHWKGFQRIFISFYSHTDAERFRIRQKKKVSKNGAEAVIGWEKLYIYCNVANHWVFSTKHLHVDKLYNILFCSSRFLFFDCFVANISFSTTFLAPAWWNFVSSYVHSCIPHLVRTHLFAVGVLGRYQSWTRKRVNEMKRRNWFHCMWKIRESNPILCPTRLIENVNDMAYGWLRILTSSPPKLFFGKKKKITKTMAIEARFYVCSKRRQIFANRSQSSLVRSIQFICIGIEIWFAEGISLNLQRQFAFSCRHSWC